MRRGNELSHDVFHDHDGSGKVRTFLPSNDSSSPSTSYEFGNCLVSMSHLSQTMLVLFLQNAVNMAKSLLFNSGLQCDNIVAEEGSDAPFECELVPILYDIINNQNSQIIDMQTALEQLGAAEYANCDVDFSDLKASSRRSLAEEEAGDVGSFVSGVDCKPCEDTSGTCEVVMGVNLYAGQMGTFA